MALYSYNAVSREGTRVSGQVEAQSRAEAFRKLDNVLATPHIGYVSRDLYRIFYQDTVANIAEWLGSRQS